MNLSMMGSEVWTVNGQRYPNADPIGVRKGELLRLRLRNHTRGLIACGALLLTALVAAVHPARAEPEPFQAMRAVRVMPPVAVPDVRFQELDGRRVGLDSFRGRPILLTFFTTW